MPLADDELDLLAKLEFCNPTGSSKDRSALWILDRAIHRGEITRDTTVVESSSGNFALALAFYCRMLGIPFVPVIDPNCSEATEAQLRLLCRRVEKVSTHDAAGGYLRTRLARVQDLLVELGNAYWPNQYANPDARDAHYRFTAAELIAEAGPIDHLFVGVGTGGTIAGVSRRIKEAFPACVVVAVDTEGSVIFGGPPKKRRIPGIGSSIVPPLCEQAVIDEVEIVPEARAVEAAAPWSSGTASTRAVPPAASTPPSAATSPATAPARAAPGWPSSPRTGSRLRQDRLQRRLVPPAAHGRGPGPARARAGRQLKENDLPCPP